MSKQRSYNRLALRGADVDDMEYVETFGLDPSVAYSKKINEALLDSSEQDNINHLRDKKGYNESDARSEAKTKRTVAERALKELYAKNGLLKD